MASLNMTSINTLFRKGYLLAVVIMAANMFVVNEMKAMKKKLTTEEVINENNMETENHGQQKENQNDSGSPIKYASLLKSGLNFVLSWENTINFFGGLVFSVANNYFKLCDYNPGGYWNLRIGCLGLRSKRFLNGMLQFEGNFNLGRGFLWLLLGAYNFIKVFTVEGKQERMFYSTPLYVSTLVACHVCNHYNFLAKPAHIVFFLLQGFLSMPLTVHIPKINLSISISFDSIIWGVAGFFLYRKLKMCYKNREEKEKDNQIDIDDNENDNKLKENDDKNDTKNDNELKDDE